MYLKGKGKKWKPLIFCRHIQVLRYACKWNCLQSRSYRSHHLLIVTMSIVIYITAYPTVRHRFSYSCSIILLSQYSTSTTSSLKFNMRGGCLAYVMIILSIVGCLAGSSECKCTHLSHDHVKFIVYSCSCYHPCQYKSIIYFMQQVVLKMEARVLI